MCKIAAMRVLYCFVFCKSFFQFLLLLLLSVTLLVRADVDLDTFKYTNLRSVANINTGLWHALYNVQNMWLRLSAKRKQHIETKANLQDPFPEDYPFPCDTKAGRSKAVPDSVHKLRPGDIDVIGAIGDSLSTGSGALSTEIGHMFVENRGLTWNMGGQWTWSNSTTLPNILREFNPRLVGYSLNDSFTYSPGSEFNTAEIGAVTSDLIGMATALVERMKSDPRVDFYGGWKMVTIMIGANDICSYVCSLDNPDELPLIHKKSLLKTLRYLRDNLPRVFVNVVSKPRVGMLLDFTKKDKHCRMLQYGICSCFTGLFFNSTNETRKWFEDIEERYMQVDEQVAKAKEFRGLNEFAAVYQPYSRNVSVSECGTH